MTDVLIYWRDYRKNTERVVPAWHSNSRLLGDLHPGDRLWLVTSGKILRREPAQVGFLVGVWQVHEVEENPGDDPIYPREDYRFRIDISQGESVTFDEPVLVDNILRPEGRDQEKSIGTFMQCPRKLDDQQVRLLRAAAGPKMALKWLTGNKP
jgi:hypothetical protein